MIVDGQPRDLGDRAYLLSPQDLAAYDLIRPLVEAGVISFKIEGRLKGGPYVAATTQTYRSALDAALSQTPFHLNRREELDLAQTFSRGLTSGFLEGVNHQKLVRGRFPKSRGIHLGTVNGLSQRGVMVRLAENLPDLVRAGDGVLFDLGTPQEKEPGGRVWRVEPKAPRVVELQFEPDSLDFSLIQPGCEVWKTDDPVLRKRLESSYSQDKPARRERIQATLAGTIDNALSLTLSDGRHQALAVWPGPLEQARKRPTSVEEIRDALGRLGETPFELGDVALNLPANAMLPKSVLNELRRQASTRLMEMRSRAQTHAVTNPQALAELRNQTLPAPLSESAPPRMTVLVRNLQQLQAVVNWKPLEGLSRPAYLYADFEDLRRYQDAVPLARKAGFPLALATNRVWKPGEDGFQSLVVRANPDAVLVRNLGSIAYYQQALPQAELIGDFSLNVANELTASLLFELGLRRLVPSFDLNWDQFAALLRRSPAHQLEPVIHQHMPMFHNEFCVFAAFLSKGKDHTDCGRPCERHKIELRDRVGSTFPVLPDTGCRNTVFNSVPQSAAEYVQRMKHLGARWFRVDLLRETPDQIGPLLARYARVIEGIEDGRETWKSLKALNQLGVTRGTLNLL
jgi:putative protease